MNTPFLDDTLKTVRRQYADDLSTLKHRLAAIEQASANQRDAVARVLATYDPAITFATPTDPQVTTAAWYALARVLAGETKESDHD